MKKVFLSLAVIIALVITLVLFKREYIMDSMTWKFALISDTQGSRGFMQTDKKALNRAVVERIAADIVLEDPDLVLVAGDLVNGWTMHAVMPYDEQYAQWKEVMKPVYDAGISVYPIRGNHDDGPERLVLKPLPAKREPPADSQERIREAFLNAFDEYSYIPQNGPEGEERLEYSFSHKNAFFVGMDFYNGGQHRINLDWVTEQLAANKKKHVFVYGHEPAFETIHKDNLSYYPHERDKFWDALGAAGGRVYFCGHDHLYNRALIKDSNGNEIRQIIAATGGGGLRDWNGVYKNPRVQGEFHNQDYHGYVLVTVKGSDVTIEWKALINKDNTNEPASWAIMDSYTYTVADR